MRRLVCELSSNANQMKPFPGLIFSCLVSIIFRTVQLLAAQTVVDYGNIHLIGHDLGAHAASYVGRRIFGIGRITGVSFKQKTSVTK